MTVEQTYTLQSGLTCIHHKCCQSAV